MVDEKKPRHEVQGRDTLVKKETPAGGVPSQPWIEEPTGVGTDVQVFRQVKEIRKELQDNKRDAARAHGNLKNELTQFKTEVNAKFQQMQGEVGGLRDDVKENTIISATASGKLDVLLADRRAKQPSDSSGSNKLLDHIVTEQRSKTEFNRKLILQIASGVFSASFLTFIVTYMLTKAGACG